MCTVHYYLRRLVYEVAREVVRNDYLFKEGVGFPTPDSVKLSESGWGEYSCCLPGVFLPRIHGKVSSVLEEGERKVVVDVLFGEEDGHRFEAPRGLRKTFPFNPETFRKELAGELPERVL